MAKFSGAKKGCIFMRMDSWISRGLLDIVMTAKWLNK